MDHHYLDSLRRHHPVWRLLAADTAPLVLVSPLYSLDTPLVSRGGIQGGSDVGSEPVDGDRTNNDVANLATLCPNCHKMHDIGLVPT